MLWIHLLAACTTTIDSADTADTGAGDIAPAPSVAWVSPQAESTVGSTVNASVVVENFLLVDPAKHSEGDAAGFIRVTVNDEVAGDFATTTFTLSALGVGTNVLGAQLFYDDGDAVIAGESAAEVADYVIVTVAPG